MSKLFHEHVQELDFYNMSKCELLRELSGYNGCDMRGVTCHECRQIQRDTLADRIVTEYEPRGKR